VAAFALSGHAAAQQVPANGGLPGDGSAFSDAQLREAARALARRPFQPLANTALPAPFANLTQEQYAGIQPRPERALFADEARGFIIEPLHRGFVYSAPVNLHVVEEGTVRRIGYDAERFTFGRLTPPAGLPDLGFAGFRVQAVAAESPPREVAVFQGATFFRSRARGQQLGSIARALSIRTADPRGEEIPFFRSFWIERPPAGSAKLTLHALAESESVVALFRFTLHQGEVTIIDTEATLFARAAVDHIGFAGMQGSYFFGANDRRGVDDLRPAAHEVGGLQMLNGKGEWIWRPVQNPETLQISSFIDLNPKGFGLVQRERDFQAFQDDDQRYELRPSLWIEPIGEWGAGAVQLVEIPSDQDIHDNIIAYWRPAQALAAQGEMAVAYRQFWAWVPPERPPLALVQSTRVGRAGGGRRRRFLVEFAAESLGQPPATPLRPVLTAAPGTVSTPVLHLNPARRTARVLFELDPGNENACELRLVLQAGEQPFSETWLYRWTP
jgi:glucans biosynthesis protein